jgi:hypothetical protein
MRFALFLSVAGLGLGSTIFTLNTTPLETSSAAPFTLDFQLNEGDGAANNYNQVTLSSFGVGGGSINTAPTSSMGGITVTTSPFEVVLAETSFFNDVQFSFTPGSSLSFTFSSTTNSDPIAPDTFSFAIYDNSGNEIATTNPNGFDSFVEVDLPSGGSGVSTILSGSAAGASVILNPPTQGSSNPPSVPEPSYFGPISLLAAASALKIRRSASS